MRIKFNYVRDYAVLYREDFIKYVGTILPKTIKRDHVNDVIVRCKRTASDPSKQTDIRPLLFDLLDNIATTKLPKGKCEFCDSGCGLYANGEEIVPVIVNDEGNIAIKTACFVEFLLSFDNQEEDFSIDNVIEMCKVDITDFVIRQSVAEQGYGLDILVHDTNPLVRLAVAKQGYGLDVLVNDENWMVCEEAERQLANLTN